MSFFKDWGEGYGLEPLYVDRLFPDVRGRRVGDCRRGRDLKASGLRAVAVPSWTVVPGRVELPTSTLSV